MGYFKKILAMGQFNIVGYNSKGGLDIIYIVETQDPQLKEKIQNNTLEGSERNFLVSSISEYFEATVASDNKLFDCGIGNIIIPEINNKTIKEIKTEKFNFPVELLNINWIENSSAIKSTKNQETGERSNQFSKNYFNKLDVSEKINLVTNVGDFFDWAWGEDYLDKRVDLRNFIVLSDGDQSNFVNDKEEVAVTKSTFRKKLAKLLDLE